MSCILVICLVTFFSFFTQAEDFFFLLHVFETFLLRFLNGKTPLTAKVKKSEITLKKQIWQKVKNISIKTR